MSRVLQLKWKSSTINVANMSSITSRWSIRTKYRFPFADLVLLLTHLRVFQQLDRIQSSISAVSLEPKLEACYPDSKILGVCLISQSSIQVHFVKIPFRIQSPNPLAMSIVAESHIYYKQFTCLIGSESTADFWQGTIESRIYSHVDGMLVFSILSCMFPRV